MKYCTEVRDWWKLQILHQKLLILSDFLSLFPPFNFPVNPTRKSFLKGQTVLYTFLSSEANSVHSVCLLSKYHRYLKTMRAFRHLLSTELLKRYLTWKARVCHFMHFSKENVKTEIILYLHRSLFSPWESPN